MRCKCVLGITSRSGSSEPVLLAGYNNNNKGNNGLSVVPLTSSYACASVLLTTAAKYAAEPNPGFVNREEKASTLLTPGQQHRRFHTPEMTAHHPISSLLTQASAVTCATIGVCVCVCV